MKRDAKDDAFSRLVRRRANWKCEACGNDYSQKPQGLHCSHLFGRRSRATRWHSLNSVAHCFGCHQRLGSNPDTFSKWMRAHCGDEVIDRLQFLHNLTIKLSKADLKDVEADLKAQAKTQQPGEGFDTPATILLAIQEAESSAGRVFVAGLQ